MQAEASLAAFRERLDRQAAEEQCLVERLQQQQQRTDEAESRAQDAEAAMKAQEAKSKRQLKHLETLHKNQVI